jgi:hypothetical protein
MAINKRPVNLSNDLKPRFAKISKADWAEIFCDLYFESNGIGEPTPEDEEAMMQDAERRLSILKCYR